MKKNNKNFNHWKNNFNSQKKTKKKLIVEKKVLFFCIFFSTTKKQSYHQFFVLFFLSKTEKKIEKSVWEWVLRYFLKKKKFVSLFTFLSSNEFTIRNFFLFELINKTSSFFSFHNIIIFNFNIQPFLSNQTIQSSKK